MKKILEFNKFIQKFVLNEGGGAGKNFSFNDITFDIKLKYSNGKISEIKKEVDLGDVFDLSGYNEGLSNIKTDIFETELVYTIDEEKMKNLTVKEIEHYNFVFTDKNDDENLYDISKSEDILIDIEGGGKLEYMYGAGWLTPHVEKDQIIALNMDDLTDGYNTWIDNKNVYDCLYDFIKVKVNLKLTEKFCDLWKDLFIDPETYEEYLKNVTDGDDVMGEEEFYEFQYDNLVDKYCE